MLITTMDFALKLIFVCVILIHVTSAYRTDISEGEEAQFCEYRKHLTFKPTATCCMGKVLKPGIDVTTHWGPCVGEVAGKSNTIAKIGWDMYSCILKKSSGGKDKLSLQEFSDLMTANYPEEDIKSKINEEIKKQSVADASLTNYGKLEKIRVTYYDIEKEVCEGMPSETKEYGKIEMCTEWKEENHRAGLCCKQSYPIDIRYNSLMDLGDTTAIKNTCRQVYHVHFKTTMNMSDIMEENLMEICDLACALGQLGINYDFKDRIIDNTEYWKWNWTLEPVVGFFLPQTLHNDLRAKAMAYVASNYVFNNTIEDMKNFTFADMNDGDSLTERPQNTMVYVARGNKSLGEDFKLDFMRRNFHKSYIQIPVLCSAYREIMTLMEYALYNKESCQPEEPPAETADEAAEPPPPATEKPAEEGGSEGPPPSEDGATQAPTE